MPGKRINFKQRVIIQSLIEDARTKSLNEIAKKCNINRSSIYREIVNRRISKGSKAARFMNNHPDKCVLLERFPFCCNRCYKSKTCSREIFIYDAYYADEMFNKTKFECLKGPNISTNELHKLDECVSPRVLSGQSLYHIVTNNKDIDVSERTVRRYIKNGYLKAKVIDLPRTVQRKSNDIVYEKRKHTNVKLLYGRMYDDYLLYHSQYPDRTILELDTMIGKRNDKKAILTIYEPTTKLQIGILVNRYVDSINAAIKKLIEDLEKVNAKFFDAILTDNGSEFDGLPLLEIDNNGVINFKLFYCDPYASYQKGGCERNHEFFRYIKRKGISFDSLTQFELDAIFSNINSYKRKSLNGLSPYEAFKIRYGINALEVMNMHYVKPLDVILKQ